MTTKTSSRHARSQPGEDALGLLAPVVISREAVKAVLDDAVERGRITTGDATELLAALLRHGRRQTEDVIRVAGVGAPFPIAGYEDLTAAHVSERLAGLDAPELRRVRDHERRNANRKSVLAAIDRRLP